MFLNCSQTHWKPYRKGTFTSTLRYQYVGATARLCSSPVCWMERPDKVAIFKHLILQDLSSFILFNPRMGSLGLLRKMTPRKTRQEAQGWHGFGNIFLIQGLHDVTQVAYPIPLNGSWRDCVLSWLGQACADPSESFSGWGGTPSFAVSN